MKIPFKKLNEKAIIPEFKHPEDAGKDLFPVSVRYNEKYDRLEYGLGFATAIPEGFVIFKHRVPFETLFPDGDYELNVNELINELAPYKPGEAIAQALLHKREDWEFTEVNELDETERGADGGLNREGK